MEILRITPLISNDLLTWGWNAQCMIHSYYTRDHSGKPATPLCVECYDDLGPDTQRQYIHCIRHGIYVVEDEVPITSYLECSSCYVILSEFRLVTICNDCSDIFDQFLEYLEESGEHPFNNSEPTLIAVSQVRSEHAPPPPEPDVIFVNEYDE